MNKHIHTVAAAFFSLGSLLACVPVHATIATIKNDSSPQEVVTLSDFISYATTTATGNDFTIHLARGNAADDVPLPAAGTKNFDIGTHKSWHISWINDLGVEVETDTIDAVLHPLKVVMAMFESSVDNYSIEFDLGIIGDLPIVNDTYLIDNFGRLVGTGFDWITFYDVSQSSTGFIERDADGNPISPFLPAGTQVTPSFLWSVSLVPEPSILILLGAAFGALFLLRRKTNSSFA